MKKPAKWSWTIIWILLGLTSLALLVALLRGQPRGMNILGSMIFLIVCGACINGSYISFKIAIDGIDADTGKQERPKNRVILGLCGIVTLAFVWFVILLTA